MARKKKPAKGKSKNPAELVIFGNPSKARAAKQPGGTRRRLKKGRRRNAGEGEVQEMEQAVELYETFQGKRPHEVIEEERSGAMRTTYTALGPLLAIGLYVDGLKIPSPDHWEDYPGLKFARGGEDLVRLVSNPEGSQLYAIGGDQDCSGVLESIPGADPTKDLVDLGEAAFVVYEARKKQDNFQLVEYMHEFEEPRPRIAYDQIKRELTFLGGGYAVEAPGIVK